MICNNRLIEDVKNDEQKLKSPSGMPPLISIVIPLYNKAPHVARAINSVIGQTINNFEIIIVGGRSSDGGENIVKQYTDPRIRFIDERHIGVSAARNQGIDESRGELIAFLDADDEWLPFFLETILNLHSKYPDAGLYATSYGLSINNRVKKNVISDLSSFTEGYLSSYFKIAEKYPFYTSCVVIPKKIFGHVGVFNTDYVRGEDREMWAKIALRYPICQSTKMCVLYYQDAVNQATKRFIFEKKEPVNEYIRTQDPQIILRYEHIDDLKNYLNYEHLAVAWMLIRAGEPILARNVLSEISVSKYTRYKYALLLMTCLPTFIMQIVSNILHMYRHISYYLWRNTTNEIKSK